MVGIADLDIRREALSTPDIQNKSVNDVIGFVEGREKARNATPTTPISALSAFKKRLTRMIPPRSSHYETYTSKCHVPTVGGNLTFISRRQMLNGTPNHTHKISDLQEGQSSQEH